MGGVGGFAAAGLAATGGFTAPADEALPEAAGATAETGCGDAAADVSDNADATTPPDATAAFIAA
ncbi:MAG: hypothetical protein ACKOEO_04150, partial [Planctomycetaceae bacterium]